MEVKGSSATGYKPLNPWIKRKGGLRACIFIFVLTAFENIGFVANLSSLVLYFTLVMHFDLSASANTLTNLLGSTYLLSLIGGFISDTYLNRLNTCLIFGSLEVLALMMFTIQAHYQKLLPEPCMESSCIRGSKALYFYTSLCLLALGAGGLKGSLPALGGDQIDQKDQKYGKALASFFNWLILSSTIGGTIGVTIVVWISMNRGWYWGFLISTLTAFVGFIILALGKPFYRLPAPANSPIMRIAQVIVVAIRNRNLLLPQNPDELYERNDKEMAFFEEKILHTNQLRWLDKAAIRQGESDPGAWKVCTVTQVEEVKILTKMLPIIASTILVNTCLAQLQTFSVQQGYVMDLHLGSFKVPAPSIPVIPLVFIVILVPIYEFAFVPLARKLTQHPSGITQLQRVGIGLILSAVSMGIAGIVEVKRRHRAIKNPSKPISLFWLAFQYATFGIADMFTLVGLLEFYYKEAPSGMRSLSTSFTWLSLSIGYFLSSVFVEVINSITKRLSPGKHGWLQGKDLNKNKLNLFYWFLAIISCLNFVNYAFWASWYKYKTDSPEFGMTLSSSSPLFRGEEHHEDRVTGTNGSGVSSADTQRMLRK